ncbi:MAG: diguanylate cyclase [Acidobacteriaceae bacterium]|nr:diguanylate cyclase [Acidobacteriaceae bacterium]
MPAILQNQYQTSDVIVFAMVRKLFGKDPAARQDAVLDAAYEVTVENDVPALVPDASKCLVFIYEGIQELRFVVVTMQKSIVVHLRPGAICFVPVRSFVRCRWLGSTRMLVLIAGGSGLESLARKQHLPEIDFSTCYVIQEIQTAAFNHLIIDELRNSSRNQSYLEALLHAFFIHLTHQLTGENEARTGLELSFAAYGKLIQYVQENLTGDISVKALAQLTGLGARQFSRRFRFTTGMSPCQWIIQKRLEAAGALLENTELSMSEIANHTGFADQSHFARNFVRQFKKTPMLYRSLVKAKQQDKVRLQIPNSPGKSLVAATAAEQGAAEPAEIDFRLLSDVNADVISLIRFDWTVHYTSPSCKQVLGWEPQEMNGKNAAEFILAEDIPFAEEYFRSRVSAGATALYVCVRMRKKDGTYAYMEINARVLSDGGKIENTNVLLTMRDITQRKEREKELERMAYIDEVTGLPNRHSFEVLLEKHWKKAVEDNSRLSLILLNVDHFKEYNEQHGAARGDRCLSAIANTVCKVVDRNYVARYVGGTIAVLLPNSTGMEASRVAEKIRASIVGLHLGKVISDSHEVTVSVGCVTTAPRFKGAISSTEDLIRKCHLALVDAKLSGRNCISIFDQDEIAKSELCRPETTPELQG